MQCPKIMSQGGQNYKRKSIRLKNYDYSRPGFYFVTICVNKKICCLGDVVFGDDEFAPGEVKLSELGRIVKDIWLSIPEHHNIVELDEFIIMPNHMHGIIVITDVGAIHELPSPTNAANANGAIHELPLRRDQKDRRQMLLPKIIGKFKMNSAEKINNLLNRTGTFWQRNYYEHIIRNERSLVKIRRYIRSNPNNWYIDIQNPNKLI